MLRAARSTGGKHMDYLFVLPGSLPYPTGGHKMMYELARRLSKDGHNVGILFVRDIYRCIYGIEKSEAMNQFLKSRSKIFRSYEKLINTHVGYRFLLPILRKAMKVEYSDNLDGILVFFTTRELRKYTIRFVFASSWQAAYVVNVNFHNSKKFYLIHHEEDSTPFASKLATIASNTYSFDLKKIVINQKVFERFKNDDPILITAGHEIEKYFITVPPEDRKATSVIFPLRKGEDKGATFAIEVAYRLHLIQTDVTLISFGNYDHDEIPDFIDHKGFVSDKELVALYNSSSVLFLPSIVEGFSLIGLEAMACGVLVVTLNNGGVNEYLIDGHNGVIVKSMDPSEVVDTILELFNDNKRRSALVIHGIETAKNFTYDSMYQRFRNAMDVYSEYAYKKGW